MHARFQKYRLNFKQSAGTSRGFLNSKDTYFLILEDEEDKGIGETGWFKGLSFDDVPDYEDKLDWVCRNIQLGLAELLPELQSYPSIQFGLEQAFLDLKSQNHLLFDTAFTRGEKGIPINGLIWMGEEKFMREQLFEKSQAFRCVKLKIGTNWSTEKEILKDIRKQYSAKDLEIRVDANGGFSYEEVLSVLSFLAKLEIHSIEQPIEAGQIKKMANLCKQNILPIALDEELIGRIEKKSELLDEIQPQYLIIKPSLVGGFKGSEEWISLAEKRNIPWWITSALESNIGLSAIAQFTSSFDLQRPQGLGTGSLFSNNIPSPLKVKGDELHYNPSQAWELNRLN